MSVRILIVDDHPLLSHGLRKVLEQHLDLSVVGEAATGAAAVDAAIALKPDLVIMDVHLPDTTGVDVTRRLLETLPHVRVVIFSGDASRSLVDAALQAGAAGYILKRSVVEELVLAIGLVCQGSLYLSPEIREGILEDYRRSLAGEGEPPKPSLSERDRQLLQRIALGKRTKEIAQELGLSAHSVETFRARLMKKVGCRSVAELVRFAIREGIAEP
jgi:DNA-binding NarL/FixJ family response regulator